MSVDLVKTMFVLGEMCIGIIFCGRYSVTCLIFISNFAYV